MGPKKVKEIHRRFSKIRQGKRENIVSSLRKGKKEKVKTSPPKKNGPASAQTGGCGPEMKKKKGTQERIKWERGEALKEKNSKKKGADSV